MSAIGDCKVAIRFATAEECKKERTCSLSSVLKHGKELVRSVVNTLGLFTSGFNLHKIEARSKEPNAIINQCPFLAFTGIPTHHAATIGELSREILKTHRGDESRGFVIDNGPNSIFGFIKDMLGDRELSPDDIMFTCSPEYTKTYKRVLDRHFSSRAIAGAREKIEKMCASFTRGLPTTVNAEQLSLRVAVASLQIVLFDDYDAEPQFAESINCFFEYILRKFEQKPTVDLQIELHRGLFWMTIERGLKEGRGAIGAIQREELLSEKQLKMCIFSLFFAGMDSTRWSLTHCLYEVAKDESLQSTDESLVKQVIVESLRIHPPVIGVSRVAAAQLSIDQIEQEETKSYFIFKGDLLLPAPNLVGRDPRLFPEDPNHFRRNRHDPSKIPAFLPGLPWHPFGYGVHLCPGASLYNELAPLFLRALLSNYKISTDRPDLTATGSFINKIDGPVRLKLQIIYWF